MKALIEAALFVALFGSGLLVGVFAGIEIACRNHGVKPGVFD